MRFWRVENWVDPRLFIFFLSSSLYILMSIRNKLFINFLEQGKWTRPTSMGKQTNKGNEKWEKHKNNTVNADKCLSTVLQSRGRYKYLNMVILLSAKFVWCKRVIFNMYNLCGILFLKWSYLFPSRYWNLQQLISYMIIPHTLQLKTVFYLSFLLIYKQLSRWMILSAL